MSLTKPFDKSRDHGTITGDPRFAYEQNGQLYNAIGQPVDGDGKLLNAAPEISVPQAPERADPDEELDLRRWADGEITAAWRTVTGAIARRFDVIVNSKIEAIDLVNQKLPKA